MSNEINSLKKELTDTKDSLQKANLKLAEMNSAEEDGLLVHLVFLKTKTDIEAKNLIAEIEKLRSIPVIKKLQIGTFTDLGDQRALSNYGVTFQMTFSSAEDYTIYQKHPVHLNLRDKTAAYMAGPPATYDYIVWKE